MTDLAFPSNPALYDRYTVGSKTWYWDGTTWRAGAGPAVDPYFSSVVALVTGQLYPGLDYLYNWGPAHDRWYTSSQANTLAARVVGSSSSITPKFGQNCIMLGNADGVHASQANTYLITTQANAALALGTADFCLDAWIYPISTGATQVLFDWRKFSQTGVYPVMYVGSTGILAVFVNGSDRITSAAGAVTFSAWNYVAWARVSGNSRLYLNANQVGSTYVDSNNYLKNTSADGLGFGYDIAGNAGYFKGYVQDMRITAGSGRGYSGTTITVPTSAAPTQ